MVGQRLGMPKSKKPSVAGSNPAQGSRKIRKFPKQMSAYKLEKSSKLV